jgi:hypothetical protein
MNSSKEIPRNFTPKLTNTHITNKKIERVEINPRSDFLFIYFDLYGKNFKSLI